MYEDLHDVGGQGYKNQISKRKRTSTFSIIPMFYSKTQDFENANQIIIIFSSRLKNLIMGHLR